MKNSSALLLLLVLAVSLRTEAQQFRTLSGDLFFPSEDGRAVPPASVIIELWLHIPAGRDYEIKEVLTDETGHWQIRVGMPPANVTQTFYYKARLASDRMLFTVVGIPLLWESPQRLTLRSNVIGGRFDRAETDFGQQNVHQVWNTLRTAMGIISGNAGLNDLPKLQVSIPADPAQCYFNRAGTPSLVVGRNHFGEPHSVVHELGHWLMFQAYQGDYPGKQCPAAHRFAIDEGEPCAWVEGWADFFALVGTNSPDGRFNQGAGSINLELYSSNIRGLTDEGRVAAALWDLYDRNNDSTPQGRGDPDIGVPGLGDGNGDNPVTLQTLVQAMRSASIPHQSARQYSVTLKKVLPAEQRAPSDQILKYNYIVLPP